MASFNSSLFLGLLVVISAFMAAPSSVEAQIRFVRINGTSRVIINMTLVPLPNERAELRCRNKTLANREPDGYFIFLDEFTPDFEENLVDLLLNPRNCEAVVKTPLAQCNANLSIPAVQELVAEVERVLFSTVSGVNIINPILSQSFRFRNLFG